MRFQTAVISRLLRRALLRGLKQSTAPSGLFYLVCLALAGGTFAAADAGSMAPGFALNSAWVYRAEVGSAFMGAIYIVGMALWLAWHGRGFFEVGAFGLTLKAPEAEELESAEAGSSDVTEKVGVLRTETVEALRELDERLSSLEDRVAS